MIGSAAVEAAVLDPDRRFRGRPSDVRRPSGGEVARRPDAGVSGRRAACRAGAGDGVPQAWEVTEFLYGRFREAGVTGMLRNHTPLLAVLLVRDDFVVWSDGRVVWWLSGDEIAMYAVAEPDVLWRLAYARYQDGSEAAS